MKQIISILFILLLSSCATKEEKKDRQIVNRFFDLFEEVKDVAMRETGLGDQLQGKRQPLPENFRMAVAFVGPSEKKSQQPWEWTQADKDQIISVFERRKGKKLGKVFELIDTGAGNDLKGLRTMARQQGADALLVIQGASKVESDLNTWGLTYLALVPTLFVEGNDVHSDFITQAVLWDVRNQYVHLGAQSEGNWTSKRPLVFRQIPRVVRKAKEESLMSLSSKLEKEITEL